MLAGLVKRHVARGNRHSLRLEQKSMRPLTEGAHSFEFLSVTAQLQVRARPAFRMGIFVKFLYGSPAGSRKQVGRGLGVCRTRVFMEEIVRKWNGEQPCFRCSA